MILYNEKQLQCIEHPPAPLMIIAGAGTGKTTTLIGRIAYFINQRDIAPQSILVLTYTVKAAEHLKKSIPALLNSDSIEINASNFHSFALNQIENHHETLGYSALPTFIDPSEVKCILREVILNNIEILSSSIYKKDISVAYQNVPKMFDRFRDELLDDKELLEKRDLLLSNENNSELDLQLIDCINLFFKYQKFKSKKSWIDFGDMIIDLWKLVNDEKVLSQIQNSIKHIFVDEYQDNNFGLSQIAMKISGEDGSITVVGDDDQSIYSFRGANVIAFNEFRDHYSSFKNYAEILLDINYRSTQSILDFANQTVKNNSFRIKNTSLISNKQIDNHVVLHSGDKAAQINKILLLVRKYLGDGVEANQICILTRSRSNAIDISNYLNKYSIKNSYRSGKLFESETAKNFISFINVVYKKTYLERGLYRLLLQSNFSYLLKQTNSMNLIKEEFLNAKLNNNQIVQYLRNCSKNLTKDPIKLFLDFSRKYLKVSPSNEVIEMIAKIIEKYNMLYLEILNADVCDYLNSMFELNEILMDEKNNCNESVSIMTIHQSKGMEFEHVMIPFLASQTFPITKGSSTNLDNIPDAWVRNNELLVVDRIEEERRVFHVAVTRAKKNLHLFAPVKRRSRFFKEIEATTYKEVELINENIEKEEVAYPFKYKNLIEMPYSATSLSLYEKCPLSFKLNKIDQINDSNNFPAATFGLYIHKVLEQIFNKQINSNEEIKTLILEIWNEDKFENSFQSDEYRKEAINVVCDYVKSNPPSLSNKHYFEESITINLKGRTLYGKIDRIDIMKDGSIRVLDYKTSKLKKNTRFLKKDMQLAFYSFLIKNSEIEGLKGRIPDVCSLEFIRDSEEPSVDITFEESDLINLKHRIENIVNSIEKNNFSPQKNANCFFCEYKKLLCPLYK